MRRQYLITVPSGVTNVGICCSGLTRFSSASADFLSQVAALTMRYGALASSSAASTIAEPELRLP